MEEIAVGVTISVPEPLDEWVKEHAAAKGYGSPAAYVAELIRRDREDESDRDATVAALEAGEASGISERNVLDIVAALKAGRTPGV